MDDRHLIFSSPAGHLDRSPTRNRTQNTQSDRVERNAKRVVTHRERMNPTFNFFLGARVAAGAYIGGGGGGSNGEWLQVREKGGEAAGRWWTYESEIRELMEGREASGMFAESKFRQLDGADGDGILSVGEMEPAVADISAALGMPAQESSPNADHISEAMSDFSHGKQKQEEVSRTELQGPLSDILLGMAAAGLKKDPIVILRIDGEDLRDFVSGPLYEPEAAAIFSQVVEQHEDAPLRRSLLAALGRLGVHHGMPPASDPWVSENVIEPALQQLEQLPAPSSRDVFSAQLKRLLSSAAGRLQERPVIVAHTENTFDGSSVRRLLANRFELDKLLDSAWKDVPAEHKKKNGSKECLRAALDRMADAAGLPHYGVACQVDAVVNEALKMVNADDGKAAADETEFKKLLTEVLGAVMLQLDDDPIFVSTSTVIHEPLSGSSAMLSPPRPDGNAAE